MATKIVTKNSSTAGAAPTATDLVQGELAVNVADGRLYTEDNAAAIVELGVNPATEITANAGIALPDSQKATFGAGDDLQIYHTGSHSFVDDAGTGNLYIRSNSIVLGKYTGEYGLSCTADGSTDLYYDNELRLATTSTGIDVTGSVVADGLTVDAGTYHKALVTFPSTYVTNLQIGQQGSINNNASIDAITFKNTSLASQAHYSFETNNSEAVRITSAGNVGIGITSPDSVIEANITTSGSGANNNTAGSSIGVGSSGTTQPILGMRWTGASHVGISGNAFSTQIVNDAVNSNAFEMYTTGATPLVLGTNATERMRIDSSGNVGIGTSSPAYRLDVKETSNNWSGARLYNDSTGSSARTYLQLGTDAGQYAGWLGMNSSTNSANIGGVSALVLNNGLTGAPVVFGTQSTERMRIDSSGNLLVGTTSSAGTSPAKLEILGGSGGGRCINTKTAITTSANAISFNNGNGQVGSIATNGTATAYNTSSDQRLKDNIADADDAGSKIDSIQVRKYDWKADGSHQDYGMIAQELLEVAPEAVSGDADSEEMMGVDYSKLVPMLIKEIQSLRNRVAQLETGE